jgi:CRISPR-associated exonuclease Cas4
MEKLSYSEDDLLPLSLLSQFYYCQRRAGLIMLEQQWSDNAHTAAGEILHEKVHELGRELRSGQAQLRSIPLRSLELGLSGNSDCIELTRSTEGYLVPGLNGLWLISPVEYKAGKKRHELEYEVQLCAQAMCLEEMWQVHIEAGYIYYGRDRKRVLIELSQQLRQLVVDGSKELHMMMSSGVTPLPLKSKKCNECSLVELCMPGMGLTTRKYLDSIRKAAERGIED